MGDEDQAVIPSKNDKQLNTLLEVGDLALKMFGSGTTVKRKNVSPKTLLKPYGTHAMD